MSPFIKMWNCFSDSTSCEKITVSAAYAKSVDMLSSRMKSPNKLSCGAAEKNVDKTADPANATSGMNTGIGL